MLMETENTLRMTRFICSVWFARVRECHRTVRVPSGARQEKESSSKIGRLIHRSLRPFCYTDAHDRRPSQDFRTPPLRASLVRGARLSSRSGTGSGAPGGSAPAGVLEHSYGIAPRDPP